MARDGGRTGELARLERKLKVEKALSKFIGVEFKIEAFGNGRGVHIVSILIYTCPATYIKDGWTLRDHKTAAGITFENAVRTAAIAVLSSLDTVDVSWSTNALSQHMERMKSS